MAKGINLKPTPLMGVEVTPRSMRHSGCDCDACGRPILAREMSSRDHELNEFLCKFCTHDRILIEDVMWEMGLHTVIWEKDRNCHLKAQPKRPRK